MRGRALLACALTVSGLHAILRPMRPLTIKSKILSFHQQLQSDKHHRYKSWEHCFSYFSKKKLDEAIACLHLSFYLASWGMYRGSSFLLWKDYLVHREVVKHILSLKHLRSIDFSKQCKTEIHEIFELSSWIRNWYQRNMSQSTARLRQSRPRRY